MASQQTTTALEGALQKFKTNYHWRLRNFAANIATGLFITGGAAVALAFGKNNVAYASSDALPPAKYPWNHKFPWQGYDHHRY
jgi:hypothetical protein